MTSVLDLGRAAPPRRGPVAKTRGPERRSSTRFTWFPMCQASSRRSPLGRAVLPDLDRRSGLDAAVSAGFSSGAGGATLTAGRRPGRRRARALLASDLPCRDWQRPGCRPACRGPGLDVGCGGGGRPAPRRRRSLPAGADTAGVGAEQPRKPDACRRRRAGGGPVPAPGPAGPIPNQPAPWEIRRLRNRITFPFPTCSRWPRPRRLPAWLRHVPRQSPVRHERPGRRCDFLTLAGDWPYSYRNDTGRGGSRRTCA